MHLVLVLVGVALCQKGPPPMRLTPAMSFLQTSSRDISDVVAETATSALKDISTEDGMKLIQSLSQITGELQQMDKELDKGDEMQHRSLVNSMHQISSTFRAELGSTQAPLAKDYLLPQQLVQTKQIRPGDPSWLFDPNAFSQMMSNPWLDPRFRDAYDQWREAINFADVLSRPDYEYKGMFVPGVGVLRPYIQYPRPWMDDVAASATSSKWGGAMGLPGMLFSGIVDAASAGKKGLDKLEKTAGGDLGIDKALEDKTKQSEADGEAAKNEDDKEEENANSVDVDQLAGQAASLAENANADSMKEAAGAAAKMMATTIISQVPQEIRDFLVATGEISKAEQKMLEDAVAKKKAEDAENAETTNSPSQK